MCQIVPAVCLFSEYLVGYIVLPREIQYFAFTNWSNGMVGMETTYFTYDNTIGGVVQPWADSNSIPQVPLP